MASRTKGFFEQDHRAKPRPGQWHRGHHNNKQPLSELSPNVALPKPAIPATSQTKSKLKAFQFIPGQPEQPDDTASMEAQDCGGEEQSDVPQSEETSAMQGNSSSAPERPAGPATSSQAAANPTAQTPQLPHANTFPCTPGTRLPLEDLIGNFDENARKPPRPEPSPEEQLGWIPNSSSTLLTPRRKRKRAKSSSPSCPATSSQRQEASMFFVANGTQGEKRTPDVDPTTALWQTYGAGKDSEGGLKLPDFSHLVCQASPRPNETPVKSAGFRRWASTGNDWPSSKNKRRRMNSRTNISLWRDEQQVESGGKTKVAEMVEKIQETLATQKLAQSTTKQHTAVEALSSSSPVPETGVEASIAPNPSPLHAKQQPPALPRPNPARISQAILPPAAHLIVSDGPVIDREVAPSVQTAPDVIRPAPLHLQSKAPLPAYKRPSISGTINSSGRQYPMKQPSQPPPPAPAPAVNDFDEFGDDFDLTAEDLDELASQVPLDQRSLQAIPQHPDPPPPQSMFADQVPQAPRAVIQLDDDDDEFGGGDLDADTLVQAEFSATQAYRASHPPNVTTPSPRKRSPPKARSPRKAISPIKSSQAFLADDAVSRLQRYKVKQVVDGECTNVRDRRCPEKLLMAESERGRRTVAITLRDSWTTSSVSPGDIIHVAELPRDATVFTPQRDPLGQHRITDEDTSPFLIVHPDHMLSATTVADSFDCIRKAVLQDRIKATGETNKPMVYGKILHEIFQQALSANQWDTLFLADLVDRTIQSHVEGLWELGMRDTVLATEEVTAKMGELAAWAKIFVAEQPSDVSLVDDKQGEKVWMSISKLIAIEEHVWSPRYGLKGNIDATIESTLVDHPNEPPNKLVTPFEVKTGRTVQSPAHRAQTALYTLLLSDRYDVAVKAGILYYLESSTMSRIAPPVIEIRQMVQQRNRLATYIHRAKYPRKSDEHDAVPVAPTEDIEESGLPALLKNPFKCGRCYAQQSCFTYHALLENGTAESAGMVDDGKKNHALVWHEAVDHLALSTKNKTEATALKAWFAKWDKLLTFEESEMARYRKELWTMTSSEREAIGRCFGNLVLSQDLSSFASTVTQTVVDGIKGSGGKINRYAYVLKRAVPSPGTSFAEGAQLNIGEPVVVSSERGQWALANGYVIAATKHDITVAVDRRLGGARQRLDGFDAGSNHAFRGIMTVNRSTPTTSSMDQELLYRLDKDEFSNGLALVRNILVITMSSHPVHTKLRQQIVFGARPSFSPPPQLSVLPPSQLGEMNEDQRAAVSKVLSAEDYALILGMPGTGKTTTIAHVIRALLAEDKTILLTSFTHTAVDNILLKIRDIAPPNSILRLGVPAKINQEVQKFCQLAATPRTTIDEIEQTYMGCRIVATTCMGTNHAVFNQRVFDFCIVDEASQTTLPTSLGPLLHARKFVLVGDHYQLPPLVQNRMALGGGLDVSLFRQLSEAHPEAVATLGKQYRMCADIMSLSNALIYNGQLRCGDDAVARRTLAIEDLDSLRDFHNASNAVSACSGRCWLADISAPERKVLFANTDQLGKDAVESLTSGKNITNQVEATLSAQLVLGLLKLGVPGKSIGVITLYRSQLALMRQLFKIAGIGSEVEIDSADRFQGRDKECIILSMVRSNEVGIVGDLLKDWRRVNVALTRAKSKLIVLGSRRTLVNNELLARLLNLVDERGWAIDLPKNAHTCHAFNFGSQSSTSLVPQSTPSPAKQLRDSPRKQDVRGSPQKTKTSTTSPSKILKPSASAGNRSPAKLHSKVGNHKAPGRVIKGQGMVRNRRASALKEQIAMDIFEDSTAEDI